MSKHDVYRELVISAKMMGYDLEPEVAAAYVLELEQYPAQIVIAAVKACRRTCKGKLTLADILGRIADKDGRPGADEAWAIASRAGDEARTVVWTEEMSAAFGVATELVIAGDMTAARMAFREAYREACEASRERGEPVRWLVSPGTDAAGRADAIRQAVELKRLPASALAEAPQADEWRKTLPAPSAEDLNRFLGAPKELKALIESCIQKPHDDERQCDE